MGRSTINVRVQQARAAIPAAAHDKKTRASSTLERASASAASMSHEVSFSNALQTKKTGPHLADGPAMMWRSMQKQPYSKPSCSILLLSKPSAGQQRMHQSCPACQQHGRCGATHCNLRPNTQSPKGTLSSLSTERPARLNTVRIVVEYSNP